MSFNKSSYQIKKIMRDNRGMPMHVLFLGGNSEVFETQSKKEVDSMCDILNNNTDSGWVYVPIEVKNN